MKVTMLGTGHATVTKCYNTCFTMSEDDSQYFLVDAGGGNGILSQLEKTNIDPAKITSMFISHTHTDHIMGSVWMIRVIGRKLMFNEIEGPFNIYGNNEVINAIKKMCEVVLPKKWTNLFGSKIIFNVVDTGSSAKILNKDVYFFDIHAKKVKQTGFFMMLSKNDKFTFIGDETCSIETEKYVKNSKWLFADAYMAGKEAEEYNPIERHHHSTVKFVANLCERLNVKNVIMSHTVDTDLKNRKTVFTEDAKKYFKGNVYIPDDLESILIKD